MTRTRLASSLFVVAALGVAALLTVFAPLASAQKAVSQGEAVTETFTIVAIDSKARLMTIKDEDGMLDTIHAVPMSSASTS